MRRNNDVAEKAAASALGASPTPRPYAWWSARQMRRDEDAPPHPNPLPPGEREGLEGKTGRIGKGERILLLTRELFGECILSVFDDERACFDDGIGFF